MRGRARAWRIRGSWLVLLASGLCAIGGCTKRPPLPAKTLRLVSIGKIGSLDPALTTDVYSHIEASRAYETLLEYHFLKRPYQLVPALAAAMPKISADGRLLTFSLRSGVRFQDHPCFAATGGRGRELVAEDFVYSFKRVADPKVASANWWLLDGNVEGLNEWRERGADYAQSVSGLRAIDSLTLEIRLTRRNYQFLQFLAMTPLAAVPREAAEYYGRRFGNHAVGTGPFRLREFNGAQRVSWERNPTYREERYPSEGDPGDAKAGLLRDAGQRLPLVDGVVVEVMVETQPQWLSFIAGKLDLSAIPKDNFAQALGPGKELSAELKAKGIRLYTRPLLDLTYTAFNLREPLLRSNRKLRQAISLAIDTPRLIELFYNGRAIAAQTAIPPGLEGYDPSYRNPYRRFDLSLARKLLAEAGYPGGRGLPPLEYITYEGSSARQMDDFLSQNLAKIGVKLNVTAFSWPQFLSSTKNGKGQVWGVAWAADYPDAENFLQLLYGKNRSPGPNSAVYENPEFDRLYVQALALPPGAARAALYQRMARLAAEDMPWVLGVHRIGYGLVQRWIQNYKPVDASILPQSAKYLRVVPELKASAEVHP